MSVVFLTNRNIISGTKGDCVMYFNWTLLEDCPYKVRVKLSTDTNASTMSMYLSTDLLTNVASNSSRFKFNILANMYYVNSSPNKFAICRMGEHPDIYINRRPDKNFFRMLTSNSYSSILNNNYYELELHFIKVLIERPLQRQFYTIGLNTVNLIYGTPTNATFFFDWTQIPRGEYDIRVKFESDTETISGLYGGVLLCDAFKTSNLGTNNPLYNPNELLSIVQFSQGMTTAFLSVPYTFSTPCQGEPINNIFTLKLQQSTAKTSLAPSISSIQYYLELTPKMKKRTMYVFNSIDRTNGGTANNCQFNIKDLAFGSYNVSYSLSGGLVDDSVVIPCPYLQSNLFNGLKSFKNNGVSTNSVSIGFFTCINDQLTLSIDNTEYITEHNGQLETNVYIKLVDEDGSLWTDGIGLCSDWIFILSFEEI